jgi:hypothetical protein
MEFAAVRWGKYTNGVTPHPNLMTTLSLVLVLLASAVLVVVLFRSLNLPPVLGYLLVGAPSARTPST